jgi:hypothetical protein
LLRCVRKIVSTFYMKGEWIAVDFYIFIATTMQRNPLSTV